MERLLKASKIIPPNKDYLEITRMVIRQNNEILQMNAILIKALSTPSYYIKTKGEEDGETNNQHSPL